MATNTKTQLHDKAVDWFSSAFIGAVLSVIISVIIVRQSSAVQLVIIAATLAALCCSIVFLALLALRYKHILDRLGIVAILKREGNLECDLPTNVRISYKYLGMSAIHVLTDPCVSRIINNRRAQELEIIHLDPTCDAAVGSIAEVEERNPTDTQDQITYMVKMANRINDHKCPAHVRLIPHPLIPSFRVSILDDEKMYIGEYSPNSFGYFSDLIVLKNMDNQPSLFSTFQKYYERTREFAIFYQVARTLIKLKFQLPSITSSELLEKVTTELHGNAAEKLVTIQMIQNVLHEFHLDNPTGI